MNITELLDRPIAYHRVFVTLTGSVKAAILLSQAMYWQKRAKQADGWWYKTAEEWQEETGLTRHEQDTAREACKKYLQTDLRDAPARLYWKVNESELFDALIAENSQTSLPKSGKLDSRKSSTINRNAETTTETTTETIGAKATKPKANTYPELVLFRKVTRRYPNEANWQGVIESIAKVSERLGRDVTEDDLNDFYKSWTAKGYNPLNLAWLDWAVTGQIPKNGKQASDLDGIFAEYARLHGIEYGN